MLILCIRCLIIYLIVLFICRVMGKRQMGQLQPFEFVVTLIIADLATIPMAEINTPLVHGLIPLLTLTLIHYFISFLSRKSIFARKILNGKSVIVISPNGIEYDNLKKLNMNLDDLIEAMREINYFSFSEVRFGILETNGKLTIIPKATSQFITSKDLKIQKDEQYLPIILISDGKIIKENLDYTGITEEKLIDILHNNSCKEINKLIVVTIDENGTMFIQQKNKKPQTIKIDYQGEYL